MTLSSLIAAGYFAYTGEVGALGLFVGALWGNVNLFLITFLVQNVLLTRKPLQMALLILLKFPLLYGVGFFLLSSDIWDPWLLLIGLSISLGGVICGPLIKLARGTA